MTTFVSAVEPPDSEKCAYWFIFNRFQMLVHEEASGMRVPFTTDTAEFGLPLVRTQFLGYLQRDEDSIPCYSAEVSDRAEAPVNMAFLGLRQMFGRLEDSLLALAGRAVQITDWDRTHQYCGRCSSPVVKIEYERAKKCPRCNLITYPRISPAIIVRIMRRTSIGSEILLARNKRHPLGFFSVLAGFVEPGESLEECVQREVREEVGLEIKDIRYFGSQPWPFPNSLMLAFTAEYAGGQIKLEEEEIAEAGWFRSDNLPLVPPPVSIARQLIDAFVELSDSDPYATQS